MTPPAPLLSSFKNVNIFLTAKAITANIPVFITSVPVMSASFIRLVIDWNRSCMLVVACFIKLINPLIPLTIESNAIPIYLPAFCNGLYFSLNSTKASPATFMYSHALLLATLIQSPNTPPHSVILPIATVIY